MSDDFKPPIRPLLRAYDGYLEAMQGLDAWMRDNGRAVQADEVQRSHVSFFRNVRRPLLDSVAVDHNAP